MGIKQVASGTFEGFPCARHERDRACVAAIALPCVSLVRRLCSVVWFGRRLSRQAANFLSSIIGSHDGQERFFSGGGGGG